MTVRLQPASHWARFSFARLGLIALGEKKPQLLLAAAAAAPSTSSTSTHPNFTLAGARERRGDSKCCSGPSPRRQPTDPPPPPPLTPTSRPPRGGSGCCRVMLHHILRCAPRLQTARETAAYPRISGGGRGHKEMVFLRVWGKNFHNTVFHTLCCQEDLNFAGRCVKVFLKG